MSDFRYITRECVLSANNLTQKAWAVHRVTPQVIEGAGITSMPTECVAVFYSKPDLELFLQAPALDQLRRINGQKLPKLRPRTYRETFFGRFQEQIGRILKKL